MKKGLKIYNRCVDITNPHSLLSKVRRGRWTLLLGLIHTIDNAPIRILDVGGTLAFWEACGFVGTHECEITLLNLNEVDDTHKYEYIKSIKGNGTDMADYKDREFDLVVSNSVIEHVGNYEQQKKMAREVQRVGKWYFVQTPNFFFPIEPHVLLPFFQFLPRSIKPLLLWSFGLGVHKPIRLLKKREVEQLFPDGAVIKEKIGGLTNSFIVIGGWGLKR